MIRPGCLLVSILTLGLPAIACADEITELIQHDLAHLGYDAGDVTGEASTETVIAITQFQAEQGFEITGEATPQLLGALRAEIKRRDHPETMPEPLILAQEPPGSITQPGSDNAWPYPDEGSAGLEARQQACLQDMITQRDEKQKKKRGMMRLVSAVTRISSQFGGGAMVGMLGQVARDIYAADATMKDLEAAGKDLGLTTEEIEQCRDPQQA